MLLPLLPPLLLLLQLQLQLPHELDAGIDLVRLELEEVQPAAPLDCAMLVGEVDQLG